MPSVLDDDRQVRAAFAARFIGVAAAVLALAAGLAVLIIRLAGPADTASRMPIAFQLSTLLLFGGSAALHRAVHHVRRERQPRFRRALVAGLAAGVLFVGVQSYGLWNLLRQGDPEHAATSAIEFVFTAAALHGLHFTLALLFLVFVTLQAFADRYDHEYYWGVVCCAWFWHALGAIWLAILGVLALTAGRG
ncbi:MAG: cytochrome c oxidase subunit 3 [Planctomycetales bacterium]